jgi:uncharacterized membrane protein
VTWDRSGKPRALLPLFGDTHSEALAINRRGEVVGRSDELTEVVWARDGTPTALLPLPGDDLSYGAAINSRGEVAGTSVSVPPGDPMPVPGTNTAVVWRREAPRQDRHLAG